MDMATLVVAANNVFDGWPVVRSGKTPHASNVCGASRQSRTLDSGFTEALLRGGPPERIRAKANNVDKAARQPGDGCGEECRAFSWTNLTDLN